MLLDDANTEGLDETFAALDAIRTSRSASTTR